MSQYDLMLDFKIKLDILTYISWFSDFALYFEDYLMYKHDLGLMSQYDLMLDFKIKVRLCDLYFMVQ